MNPQRFQHEYHAVHVRPLYLRDRILLQFMRKRPLRIKPETRPRLRSTGSARPLSSLRLRDRRHYERFNTRTGVVGLLLAKTRIYNITDPVDRQRRLSYISANNNLPRVFGSGLEDLGLLFAR